MKPGREPDPIRKPGLELLGRQRAGNVNPRDNHMPDPRSALEQVFSVGLRQLKVAMRVDPASHTRSVVVDLVPAGSAPLT